MSKLFVSSSENALADQFDCLATQRAENRLKRRTFLAGLGAAGAATLVGCNDTSTVGTAPVTPAGPSVVDVLNFALNLEYLEASFYLYVTTGTGLSAGDMGTNAGTVTGGAQVAFVNPVIASVANQLATDEREHVEFLRSTISSIGGTPVSMPALNLAAGGAVNSDATFLAAARRLEATGISAYIGGAQYLVTNTAALTYAAQILHTESQHEGFLRELCIATGVASPALDGLDFPPSATQIFNTNPTTGLNPIRTTSQVLQIVYGTAGTTGISKGGFFPNGLNGNIATS